jgi:alpha-L-rhamnosidase
MKQFKITLIILIAILSGCITLLGKQVVVTRLKCEYQENPRGIDTKHPRLSWVINAGDRRNVYQNSYQIKIASSEKSLLSGKSLFWNSGIVQSNRSVNVAYDGPELES